MKQNTQHREDVLFAVTTTLQDYLEEHIELIVDLQDAGDENAKDAVVHVKFVGSGPRHQVILMMDSGVRYELKLARVDEKDLVS